MRATDSYLLARRQPTNVLLSTPQLQSTIEHLIIRLTKSHSYTGVIHSIEGSQTKHHHFLSSRLPGRLDHQDQLTPWFRRLFFRLIHVQTKKPLSCFPRQSLKLLLNIYI